MKNTIILISVFLIVAIGVYIGIRIYNNGENFGNKVNNNSNKIIINNEIISTIQIDTIEEKTTPNTLIIYKTYFTDCKHYVKKYEDIDASLVNLTEKEFKEKNRLWTLDTFSSKEIELSRQENGFCNEHYKVKLENNTIVIYNIDENGVETEYEQTGITTEYLTQEDILKLTTGIVIYGKENLNSTIEDYE